MGSGSAASSPLAADSQHSTVLYTVQYSTCRTITRRQPFRAAGNRVPRPPLEDGRSTGTGRATFLCITTHHARVVANPLATAAERNRPWAREVFRVMEAVYGAQAPCLVFLFFPFFFLRFEYMGWPLVVAPARDVVLYVLYVCPVCMSCMYVQYPVMKCLSAAALHRGGFNITHSFFAFPWRMLLSVS